MTRSRKDGHEIKLHFLGAAGRVTGSMHLIEYRGGDRTIRVIVDGGLTVENPRADYQNRLPKGVSPADIDLVVATHAHMDHTGLIPLLVRYGFRGPVIATGATCGLLNFMLADAAKLQEESASGSPPLYEQQDARQCISQLKKIEFNQQTEIASGVKLTALPAGHLLGAALMHFEIGSGAQKRRLTFMGNVGRPGEPLLETLAPLRFSDYIVTEATYGGQEHPVENARDVLCRYVLEAYDRAGRATSGGAGVIVIPAFSVGRGQVIMNDLSELMRQNRLPVMPVYVDSPMMDRATALHRAPQFRQLFNRRIQKSFASGLDPFSTPMQVENLTPAASRSLCRFTSTPFIVVSSSGMASGGRVLHHLRARLGQANCTVIFTGFQARETLGHKLTHLPEWRGDALPRVRVNGDEVPVRATINTIPHYSAHASHTDLINWFARLESNPRKVFVEHGEPERIEALANALCLKRGCNVETPKNRQSYLLE